jgi:hypothetical protein
VHALVGDLHWGTGSAEILAGLAGTVYLAMWISDYRGWVSWLLKRLYRWGGARLWPGGSERSYLAFYRALGWLGLAACLVLLGIGIRTFVG